MLLTEIGDLCEYANFNSIAYGNTFGVAKRSCATGYYSFGNVIASMYGAYPNRESGSSNYYYPTANGYLMRPPINSTFRTIMA